MPNPLLKKIALYKYLLDNPVVSQRKMSRDLNLSVGSINNLIKNGTIEEELNVTNISYREKEYSLTEKGIKICKSGKKINTAVILAAGEEREFNHPRSFLNLDRDTLIERHIEVLKKHNIENIYIVIGDEDKRFKNFKSELNIIINKDFKTTGTLHSLSLVEKYIKEDFILIEGDLIYEEEAIKGLIDDDASNCTIITKALYSSDNVYVNIENSNLVRISKDQYSLGNISGELVGLSKISYPFFIKMINERENNSNPLLFYEYVLENVTKTIDMKCLMIDNLLWSEIDNKDQLIKAREIYKEIKLKEGK